MCKVISDVSWAAGEEPLLSTAMHCFPVAKTLPGMTGFLPKTLFILSVSSAAKPTLPQLQEIFPARRSPRSLVETAWCPLIGIFSFSPLWGSKQQGSHNTWESPPMGQGEVLRGSVEGSTGGSLPTSQFSASYLWNNAGSGFRHYSLNLGGVSMHNGA